MQGLMLRKLRRLRTALSITELHSEGHLLSEQIISAAADHLPADTTPGTSGLSRLSNMAGKAFLGMTDLLNTALFIYIQADGTGYQRLISVLMDTIATS